jgi:hypothetical protein
MLRLSARLSPCLLALPLLALIALLASPAAAEVYHVKLHNGTSVDTAYQPVQCPWDPGMVLVMDEVGNWIGLEQNEIEGVEQESQVRGFGVAVNTSTIAIGWAPNDAADPATLQQNAPTATDLAIQKLAQEQQQRANYTVQQGVSTEQTQGIPAGLTGYGGYPPTGSLGLPGYRPPNTPPPAPVAPPAAATAPTTAPATPPGPG